MSRHTRRAFLRRGMSVPFLSTSIEGRTRRCCIYAEATSLSQESAAGFRRFAADYRDARSNPESGLVILPGASAVTAGFAAQLSRECMRGTWVIWEMSPCHDSPEACRAQRNSLEEHFAVRTHDLICFDPSRDVGSMYVRYSWPVSTWIRTFIAYVPVEPDETAIAYHASYAVAARRTVGRGGIVFLGSMLGPHLRAGDRGAIETWHSIRAAL